MGLGLNLAVLGITRKSEAEADQLGTQYLWNTGYDPHGFITFFEKLEARQKDKPGKFKGFFRTHPTPSHFEFRLQPNPLQRKEQEWPRTAATDLSTVSP